jgi:hypothetical protein
MSINPDKNRQHLWYYDNLTKVNPAIAALWNPNRPLKPAEKYGELYDNEWTDAIDCTNEVKALYNEKRTARLKSYIDIFISVVSKLTAM